MTPSRCATIGFGWDRCVTCCRSEFLQRASSAKRSLGGASAITSVPTAGWSIWVKLGHDADNVPPSTVIRGLRRGGGVPVSGPTRDQLILVSHLAGAAGGAGRGQPPHRCPAAPHQAAASRGLRTRL